MHNCLYHFFWIKCYSFRCKITAKIFQGRKVTADELLSPICMEKSLIYLDSSPVLHEVKLFSEWFNELKTTLTDMPTLSK